MRDKGVYVFKTNYFNRPWTWIKRGLVFLLLVMIFLYLQLAYPGRLLWKCLFLILCGLYIFFKPKDDLAIDGKYLYHIKRSIQPRFSRTEKYDIANIKSIRVGGIYSPEYEVMELLGTGLSNSIEINFKDNSSITLNLPVYKKELVFLVSKIKERIVAENLKQG